jgi:hypothetical protein
MLLTCSGRPPPALRQLWTHEQLYVACNMPPVRSGCPLLAAPRAQVQLRACPVCSATFGLPAHSGKRAAVTSCMLSVCSGRLLPACPLWPESSIALVHAL